MGRSDDESDDYTRKSKKRKKRRERSRSSSQDSDTSRMSSSRHKKSKRRHDRHRSPSPERRRRKRSRSRRRSRSVDSHHRRSPSPSRGRGRYSRSRSRDRRSRSRGRRSRSRDRRSYSRGRSRSRDRRSRSGSWSRTGSRRSSEDRRSDIKHSATSSPSASAIKSLSLGDSNSNSNDTSLTPAQLAEERMRQALKAAAAADEKLRGQGAPSLPESSFASRVSESQNFADKIKEIESDRFVTTNFSSSRGAKQIKEEVNDGMSHDNAIFGSLSTEGFIIKPDTGTAPVDWTTDSLMHPSLFCDVDEKMDRWIERLTQLRRRKLEGEAMVT